MSTAQQRLAVLEQQLTQHRQHEELQLEMQATAAHQRDPDGSMFAGQVIVITGGAKGIGEAAALAFAKRGAKLLLTDLDEAAVQAAAEKCRAAGSPKVCQPCVIPLRAHAYQPTFDKDHRDSHVTMKCIAVAFCWECTLCPAGVEPLTQLCAHQARDTH